MRKNLLEFLYGEAVIQKPSADLGEQVVKLFEEAADEETEEMVANKTPLASALKTLGITNTIDVGPAFATIKCESPEEYREYTRILFDPERLTTLAEKGWVPTRMSDAGMTFEPGDYRIGFIELDMGEITQDDKVPDAEKIRKDAQKRDATKMDRKDPLNPVETDDKTSDDNQKGISKAKDGEQPEGKPKGSVKESKRRMAEGGHKAGCKCGFCMNKGSFGKKKKEGEDSEKKDSEKLAESLLEMTGTSAIPTVDAPSKSGINWGERLKKLRKRRGENPETGEVDQSALK